MGNRNLNLDVALVLRGLLAGFIIILAGVTILPRVFGWQFLTVLTPSMTPVLDVGGVVAVQPVDPTRVRAGDIIVYRKPEQTGVKIAHRVTAVVQKDDAPGFRTRGDANASADSYTVPAQNLVGTVRMHVPYAGYMLSYARTPLGLLITLIIPGLALMSLELVRVAREARVRQPAPVTLREPVHR